MDPEDKLMTAAVMNVMVAQETYGRGMICVPIALCVMAAACIAETIKISIERRKGAWEKQN